MRRSVRVTAVIVLVLGGVGIAAFALVSAQQRDTGAKGPELLRQLEGGHLFISPQPGQTFPPPATASNEIPPTVCGIWSDQDIEGTVATAIVAQFGEERNCGRIGNTWVITTLGNVGEDGLRHGGVIALYDCGAGDEACLIGQNDHPLDGWKFITPPYDGGVTVLSQHDQRHLTVDNAGHQIIFDLLTDSWPAPSETRTPQAVGTKQPTEASSETFP